MTEPIDKAKTTVKGAIDAIRRLFPLNIGKIMNLKLPHISVSGGKAPFGIGGKGSLPSFSVSWYKRGGVFDRPTIIGVGDATTPEVVTPKQLMRETMDEALRANGANGVTINVYGARSDNPEDFGRRAADAYNRLVMTGMGA